MKQYRAAITDERMAMRTLLDDLRTASDDHVLRLVCLKGVQLDRDDYRAAYSRAGRPSQLAAQG